MNTMQAEYRTDIARFAEYMAKRDVNAANRAVELAAAVAKRGLEASHREKRILLWMILVITLATTIILGALGSMSGILSSV